MIDYIRNTIVVVFLIPGVIPALFTMIVIDKFRKPPATGALEEFIAFDMLWSLVLWAVAIICFIIRLRS